MDFRKIESSIDFENFDAKQAGNLVRMVEGIEHFRFSCRDQDKEHKILADLELLRKFADGQGKAIRIPCHLLGHVVRGTKGNGKPHTT